MIHEEMAAVVALCDRQKGTAGEDWDMQRRNCQNHEKKGKMLWGKD